MELVGPKKRVLMSNVISCMFSIGEALVALYAIWFRSWRHFMLVLYVPGLLVIFLPFFVPESVRYKINVEYNALNLIGVHFYFVLLVLYTGIYIGIFWYYMYCKGG